MNDSDQPLTDAEFDALLTAGGTAAGTAIQSPVTDVLHQRLQTVTEMLSGLATLPAEPSLVSTGPQGTTVTTPVGDSLVVGRSSKCGLVNREDAGLSKQHFTVSRTGSTYTVSDAGSRNKTFVNTRCCPQDGSLPLLDGDVILAANSHFVFLTGMDQADTGSEEP